MVTEHFTHYAHAFVTPSQTAWEVAKTLWAKFFMHYSLSEKILSDQGCNFESGLIAELCKISKVKKLHTMSYWPQCIRQCKCFNATLISMIGTLPTTFYLMFGRHPMLPIDLQFGAQTPDILASTSHSYIQKLQRRLKWAYKTADEVSKKELEHSKKQYDWNITCRQKALKGKHEISDRWENTLYHVIEHVSRHLPVYKVQPIGETTII